MQIVSGWPDPSLSSYPSLTTMPFVVCEGTAAVVEDSLACPLHLILMRIYQRWSRMPPIIQSHHVMGSILPRIYWFYAVGGIHFTSDILSPSDMSVDSRVSPSHVVVRLKRSKNDSFAVGSLHLSATGLPLCLVAALLGYLAIRPVGQGPQFHLRCHDQAWCRIYVVL